MPFLLIVVGALLVITSAKNTQGDLFNLVESDFTGKGSFIFWFVSIVGIGALGYIKPLKPIANGFLALIVLVLLLSEKGFFTSFIQQINTVTGQTPPTFQNVSSAGVVVALPAGSTQSSSTTVVGSPGGGVIVSPPIVTNPGGGGCPPGYEWLDSQCVPIDFFGGGGGDPFGGGGDPFGNLFSDFLRRPAMPKSLGGATA